LKIDPFGGLLDHDNALATALSTGKKYTARIIPGPGDRGAIGRFQRQVNRLPDEGIHEAAPVSLAPSYIRTPLQDRRVIIHRKRKSLQNSKRKHNSALFLPYVPVEEEGSSSGWT